MGAAEPVRSEIENYDSSGTRTKVVFAQNTGKCVEDSYPEGSILLNLGSGDISWSGWINVDSHGDGWKGTKKPDLVSDITKLPYPDNHADAIAAIHVIEHFYQWEVQEVLEEWKRVLKPGGKLILELPCMDKVFRLITDTLDRKLPLSATFSTFPLWGDPRFRDVAMCHKWGYFYGTLKAELIKAGFVNPTGEKPRYHFPNRDMRIVSTKP